MTDPWPPSGDDAPAAPQAPSETHRFPCEQCGADYRFDPNSGTLVCTHCGHSEPIRGAPWTGHALRELDFRAALAHQLPETEMEVTRVTTCPNCAAQVEFDPATHARDCPFCATPVVADTGASRHIKPRGVVPFALDEPAARRAMKKWLGGLWFAPNGLRRYARKGRRMNGIYVPYWTYDANTRSAYAGQRGTVYFVTETVIIDGRRQQRQVPRVRWTPVRGRVQRFFDDVLVMASSGLPRRDTEALEPWDLAALEPYQPEYLAGFRAEAYSVPLDKGFEAAQARMERVIERDVRFDIGGDRQQVDHIETAISDVTFKHILLPVWLAAYKFRGRTYRFVVNGQTGRVQGERPYSGWKIAIAVFAAFLFALFIAYAGSQQ